MEQIQFWFVGYDMNDINITIKSILISNDDFMNSGFRPENNRTMDEFTKKVLYTAYRLFDGDFSCISYDNTGVVLTTHTGPCETIKNTADIINKNGYKGINPSLFPNVMLSTSLAYLAMYLNVHGPSCTFYDMDRNGRDALDYCIVQIKTDNCEAMIQICADENGWAEGRYITRKDYINESCTC